MVSVDCFINKTFPDGESQGMVQNNVNFEC